MAKSESLEESFPYSDSETEDGAGTQVHSNGVGHHVLRPQVSVSIPDPWWAATHDPDLPGMLNEILTLPRIGKPQDGDLAKSEKDKILQHRIDLYTSMIKQRLSIEASNNGHETSERPLIYQIVMDASRTDLRITEFLLRLILDQDPSQICSSEDNIPLLHKAITAEGERDQCKGLTSLICTLVDDPSEAIAKTNANGENCVHLLIRDINKINVDDIKTIIGFVKADSTSNALEQGRNSKDPDSDGNTPLHDLLHFKHFAKRTIPCLKVTSSDQDISLCSICSKNNEVNTKLPDFKRGVADIMMALLKGAPKVLTQHNSTGRSPYSFHLATREEMTERRKADMSKAASAAENGNGEVNEKSNPAEEMSNTGYATKNQKSKDITGREGSEEKNDVQRERIGLQIESTTAGHEDVWDYVCKNSQQMVTYLEERLYKQTADYPCITRFFFQDIKKAGNHNKRKDRREWLWRPRKRVTDETTKNFSFLEFESRLAVVELSLQPESPDDACLSDQEHDHDAANLVKVFRWLKEKKQVTKILKLVVKDHPQRSCNEEIIEQCLGYMDEIRFLEWDKPDMSVPTIQKAKNLIGLRLHSSGMNAVLCHWADQKGLVRLRELKRVHVTVHKGYDSDKRTKANLEEFKKNLLKQYQLLNEDRGKKRDTLEIKQLIQATQKGLHTKPGSEDILKMLSSSKALSSWLQTDRIDLDKKAARKEATVDTVVPEVETDIVGLSNSGSRFSGNHSAHSFATDSEKHPGFEVATWFGLTLFNAAGGKRNPPFIKVALLDDGVDPAYKNTGGYLARNGFPPNSPEDEREPFYTSTSGHGSQMAWIISSICPFVELHVAKIDSQNNSALRLTELAFSPEQSAAAVEWAIDGEVDIISMSGSFKVATGEVNKAAQKLTKLLGDPNRKPIMYCAARDTRFNDPDDIRYYPAECAQSRRIGAATALCHAQKYVTREKTDYVFPSEYVLEHIKDGGNSVATAVAAGVAALVLYCFKKDGVRLEWLKPKLTASELMHELFNKLKDNESGYVNLSKLFEFDGRRNVSSTKLVNEVFRLLGLTFTDRAGMR